MRSGERRAEEKHEERVESADASLERRQQRYGGVVINAAKTAWHGALFLSSTLQDAVAGGTVESYSTKETYQNYRSSRRRLGKAVRARRVHADRVDRANEFRERNKKRERERTRRRRSRD